MRSRLAASATHEDGVSDEPRKSSEDATEEGPLGAHPPEGEQERSAESDETLSPDEKSA